MSSNEYLRPSKVGTRRVLLLCVGCFLVGGIVGGFAVRAARSDGDGATVVSALGAPPPAESETSTSAPSTIPAVRAMTPGTVADMCNAPESPRDAIQTIEEFRTLVVRTWMLCASPSVFGTSDEIGLEILSDNTWYKLYADDKGGLVRGEGFSRRGTWSIVDASAMNRRPSFQLDLSVFGLGSAGAMPVFAADPLKMRLNNMGIYMADYVAVTGAGG